MTVYSNTKGKMTECRGQNKYTRRKKMKKNDSSGTVTYSGNADGIYDRNHAKEC